MTWCYQCDDGSLPCGCGERGPNAKLKPRMTHDYKELCARLRGPIKHPQECVNQRQEAADRIDALEAELEGAQNYAIKVGGWLDRIVNITKGDPPPLTAHSTHDVVESVERLAQQRDELAAAVETALDTLPVYRPSLKAGDEKP